MSVVSAQYSACKADATWINYFTSTSANAFECFKECEANVKEKFNYCCQYSVDSTECLLNGIENTYDTFDIDPRVPVDTIESYALWYQNSTRPEEYEWLPSGESLLEGYSCQSGDRISNDILF